MTDQPLSLIDVDAGPAAGSIAWPRFLACVEFVLIFAGAFAVKRVLLADASGEFPSPYWFPVVMLSLQFGLYAGLFAAAAAVGLEFWNGLPQPFVTEDVYTYVGRIAAQPAAWTCVALLVGHTRSREIERIGDLAAKLDEATRHSEAVAQLCSDLRERGLLLERRLAANAEASVVDVAEAISGLYEAHWESISERLARFVMVMLGTADFSVYLLRGQRLAFLFPSEQQEHHGLSVTVEADSPLFSAIVRERKTLMASRVEHRPLLGERNLLIAPLTDQGPTGRVIGMLVIAGTDIADFPDDVERRFALTCDYLSRLFSRVILIDRLAQEQQALVAADRVQHPPAQPQGGTVAQSNLPAIATTQVSR